MHLDLLRSGPVASLVMDRPDRHNAFSDAMWAAIPDLMSEVERDRSIRVLVLRSSTERVFSAGADVEELRTGLADRELSERGMRHIRAAFESIVGLPIPTVAAIRGACHGGGVGLAVCCDVRIADTSATFSIPPARLGLLYPYPALSRLMWMIGPGQAKRLLFTADTFDAAESKALGFLDVLTEPSDWEATLDGLTARIAANSPSALRSMKRVMGMVETAEPGAEALARTLEVEALHSPDHAEGVEAFLGKRAPRFDG